MTEALDAEAGRIEARIARLEEMRLILIQLRIRAGQDGALVAHDGLGEMIDDIGDELGRWRGRWMRSRKKLDGRGERMSGALRRWCCDDT
jgi:hypothetical protein